MLPVLVATPVVVIAAPSALAAQTSGPPVVTTLLPADTAFTVLINTTEATWGQLSQFQLFSLIEEMNGVGPNPGGLPFIHHGLDGWRICPGPVPHSPGDYQRL